MSWTLTPDRLSSALPCHTRTWACMGASGSPWRSLRICPRAEGLHTCVLWELRDSPGWGVHPNLGRRTPRGWCVGVRIRQGTANEAGVPPRQHPQSPLYCVFCPPHPLQKSSQCGVLECMDWILLEATVCGTRQASVSSLGEQRKKLLVISQLKPALLCL